MRIWANILNAAGTVIGEGPLTNITSASITHTLDGAGQISLVLPADDPRVIDLVTNERRVAVYVDAGERLVGMGILRRVRGDAASLTVTVEGPNQINELDRVNTLLGCEFDGTALPTVINTLVALASGWSVDTTGVPLTDVYASFPGSNVLSALQKIAERYGLHFRWDSNKSLAMGPLGDTGPLVLVQGGSRITDALMDNDDVALIDRLEWDVDTESLVNKLHAVGGGEGGAALTLEFATRGSDRDSALTSYSTGYQDSSETLRGAATTIDMLAQSFQLDDDAWVSKALLYLAKTGSPGGTMTLRIETDSSGSPSGTLAHTNATTTLAESGLGTSYALETFEFATGFYLSGSTTYWLVLSTTRSASGTNNVQWGADASSPSYADGEMQKYQSSTWSAVSKDAVFQVLTTLDSRTSETEAAHAIANFDSLIGLEQITDFPEHSYSGGSASASSEFSATYSADKAFDDTYATYWNSSGGVPQWLQMQFASATMLYGYELLHAAAGLAPQDFNLQYYDGGWQNADVVTGETGWSGVDPRRYLLDTPTSATQWRLYVSANNGAGAVALREFNLLGATFDTKLAQSFTVTTPCRVSAVDLWLNRHNTPAGNLTVEIQTDSGGSPSGTAVTNGSGTSGTVAASGLSATPAKTTFEFANPPNLPVGTYWLVLETTDSASATDYVQWAQDSGAGYAGGVLKSYDGAAWNAESADAVFAVRCDCEVHKYAIQSEVANGVTQYYIADADSIANYGTIVKFMTASISPLSNGLTDMQNASNALYDAAVAAMERYCVPQTTYKLSLKKAYQTLKPGQKLRLQYRGFVHDADGNQVAWHDVDDEFWIIQVEESFSQSGITTTIELSDVARLPDDLAGMIVGMLDAVSIQNLHVKAYPMVMGYSTRDIISGRGVNLARAGGTVSGGTDAVFNVLIDEAIQSIKRVTIRVRTLPPSTLMLADTNLAFNDLLLFWWGVEGSDYPANLHIEIDGADISSALGGPWLTGVGDNEQFDETFEVTSYFLDTDVPSYGNHDVVVWSYAGRDLGAGSEDLSLSGYTSQTIYYASPAAGIVELTVMIFGTTQALSA